MTGWRLLEKDPLTGIERWFSYDSSTKKCSIKTLQDVTDILEWNKQQCNHMGDGYSPSREWKRVADIPLVVQHKWLAEEGIDVYNKDHWPAVARKLDLKQCAVDLPTPGRNSFPLGGVGSQNRGIG